MFTHEIEKKQELEKEMSNGKNKGLKRKILLVVSGILLPNRSGIICYCGTFSYKKSAIFRPG